MTTPSKSRSGHAVIETAFMVPWLFFLFVGVLDFGFYAYAAICTENAARVAALQISYSDDSATDRVTACEAALPEMAGLPNLRGSRTLAEIRAYCSQPVEAVSDDKPVRVHVTDPAPPALDAPPVGVAAGNSAEVFVTYRSIPMIAIPGVLTDRLTLTRRTVMRVRR